MTIGVAAAASGSAFGAAVAEGFEEGGRPAITEDVRNERGGRRLIVARPLTDPAVVITARDPWVSMAAMAAENAAGAASKSTEGYGSGMTHTGEKTVGATTRYMQDFETGEVGPEWGLLGGMNERRGLSTFADPAANGGMKLYVKTDESQAYEMRLDVYLVPSHGATLTPGDVSDPTEAAENVLRIRVDGQVMLELTPGDLRKMAGAKPQPGQPMVRKVRVPFAAAYGVSVVEFSGPAHGEESGWPTWGVDNIIIDLGLQDPVLGSFGRDDPFDTGILGDLEQSSPSGELQPLPYNRFARNTFDFDGSGGGDGGGPERRQRPEPEIPSPGTIAACVAAGLLAAARRRRLMGM